MSIADTIASFGGKAVIGQIAEQFGLPPAIASQAVGMLLPSLSAGASRNIKKEGGLASMIDAVQNGTHTSYLETPSSLAAAETTQDGNNILGHLLGGKDASRAVSATVAGALGIDSSIIKKMLPVVASVAMGAIAKQGKSANLSSDSSGSTSGDLLSQISGMVSSGGAADILGKLFS